MKMILCVLKIIMGELKNLFDFLSPFLVIFKRFLS